MQICPKYHLFWWELYCWKFKAHPGVPRNALSHDKPECVAFVCYSKQPPVWSFILSNSSFWQAPSVSREVFFAVGERKGTAIVVFPPPKCQLHLTQSLCLSLPSPPSWAQLWLSHTLDRGHFPKKCKGTFKTASKAQQQQNAASFPTALTRWIQHPEEDFPPILPYGALGFL